MDVQDHVNKQERERDRERERQRETERQRQRHRQTERERDMWDRQRETDMASELRTSCCCLPPSPSLSPSLGYREPVD